MGILALTADERVTDVKFTKDTLSVALRDGRTITVPLAWYPRLFNATAAQRKNWQVAGGGYGIHWPDVDEDLSGSPKSLGLTEYGWELIRDALLRLGEPII